MRSLPPVVAYVRCPQYPLVERWCGCVPGFLDGRNLRSEEEEHIGEGLPWNAVDGSCSIRRPPEFDYHHR